MTQRNKILPNLIVEDKLYGTKTHQGSFLAALQPLFP